VTGHARGRGEKTHQTSSGRRKSPENWEEKKKNTCKEVGSSDLSWTTKVRGFGKKKKKGKTQNGELEITRHNPPFLVFSCGGWLKLQKEKGTGQSNWRNSLPERSS